MSGKPVLSAVVGTNAELIEQVSRLYLLKPGMVVADVTFGRGVFWKNLDLKLYRFFASDIAPVKHEWIDVAAIDFRAMPYRDGTFDVVVFDPPYMHGQGAKKSTIKASIANCYRNNDVNQPPMNHARIMDDYYRPGMRECARILKPGGTAWVKCKDEIEAGQQRWSHREVYEIADELGLVAIDLFVLVQRSTPAMRHHHQHHARKNHSYLFIFEKR